MQLSEILEKHNFQIATEKEDRELQEIFEEIPLRLDNIFVSVQRRPSYFSFANLRSKKHLTFYTRDSVTNRISSVGCLSIRPAYIGGHPSIVGFFGDMRSHFNRETTLRWRGFYGDLILNSRACSELEQCQNFYTTILAPNRAVLRAYVEQKKNPFWYSPMPRATAVNIFGRVKPPFLSTRFARFKIRRAHSSDFERILEFLDREERQKEFGYVYQDELPRRLKSWPGLSIENFFLAESSSGEIIALTAPWSLGEAQQIIVEILPKAVYPISLMSKSLPLRSLVRVPKAGEPLDILYLTHFQVSSKLDKSSQIEATKNLIDYVYDSFIDEDWHFISLPVFDTEPFQKALKGYLYHQLSLHLYAVHPKGGDQSKGCYCTTEKSPGIELSLI